ncbi:MAG: MarR family transcriptional regulator [Actinomycetota bacterium]|jgi:hypothetical protein|uniref:MarR family transcriptional regulator n=1 Tax=uncultured Ilumatobacter sp. TaxID=879968 RepID=UPI00374EC607|nr:MarR family transcriptional regulator [Actinomycetota bacterium]
MGHTSTPKFCTFHALRIKGFATVDTLREMTGFDAATVQAHLDDLAAAAHAQFREARSLWQLTPDGRAAHPAMLETDLVGADLAALAPLYAGYLELNTEFKTLCGDWQLRNGGVNDHTDAAYDAAVVARLVDLDGRAQPILVSTASLVDRLACYGPRLASSIGRLQAGESNMFTGVMCGSYHDAWMELHEDLILTQGIDRSAEGSF